MRDCIGVRDLGYDDSWSFKTILYGSNFTFTAGWKVFNENGTLWN
jgi:hypothetical protein